MAKLPTEASEWLMRHTAKPATVAKAADDGGDIRRAVSRRARVVTQRVVAVICGWAKYKDGAGLAEVLIERQR